MLLSENLCEARVLNPKGCRVQGCSPAGGAGGPSPPLKKNREKKICTEIPPLFTSTKEVNIDTIGRNSVLLMTDIF